jgi:lipoprotein-anchoring transpeptidase ErfK/SrfK
VYIEVTGHGIGGGFYKFWKERGGLYYFGYPLSEEYPLFIAGIWVSAQDFERTRFIYHPTFGVSVAELGRQASEINKADTTPLGQEEGVPIMTPTAQLWERWVDVNLSKFTATYMEGDLPVRTIWVVTGMYGWDTPVGTFTIFRRVENERMRGGTIGSEDYYDLSNVLYTQYFTAAGHALHYAWWRDSFGYRASHGCVNMNLDDSFFAWNFLKIGSKVNIHY